MNITENQRRMLLAVSKGTELQAGQIHEAMKKWGGHPCRDGTAKGARRLVANGLLKARPSRCTRFLTYSLTKAGLVALDAAGRHEPELSPLQFVMPRTHVNSSAVGQYVPPAWNTRSVGNPEIQSRGVRC